jgi:hypothetical protein
MAAMGTVWSGVAEHRVNWWRDRKKESYVLNQIVTQDIIATCIAMHF